MSGVVINRGRGGLGRPLPNQDNVSGLVVYMPNASLPFGFGTSDRIKQVNSLAEAVALGIDQSFSDETKATGGQVTMTNAGSAGDIARITIDEGNGAFTLAEYTVQTGDGVNDIATGLAADMNDPSKWSHGYTAVANTADVDITAPDGLGAHLNSATIALAKVPSTSTLAATITQFSGGVDGFIDVVHYFVDEFFRLNPRAVLWIAIGDSASVDLSFVETVQQTAAGVIRQFAVFDQNNTFASGQVSSLQSSVAAMRTAERPASIIYGADYTGVTIGTIANISTLNADGVSVFLGADGNESVRQPWNKDAYTAAAMGTILGAVSAALVHENIAWVQQFNIAQDTTRFDTVRILPSTQWLNASASLAAQLTAKGYIFLKKYVDYFGSYFSDDRTATLTSSDYAFLRNVRTIDKAIRLVRLRMLPKVAQPVYVNASGQLSEASIADFRNAGDAVVGGEFNDNTSEGQMIIDGELSAGQTIINPAQNVLLTNEVVVTLELVPVGSASTITVNIGFVPQLTQTV